MTLKYGLSTVVSTGRYAFAEGAQVTVANPWNPGLQTHATPSVSLASVAISSASANLTQLHRYMLDTHEYQHLSPPLPFGKYSQLMTKHPLLFATSVLMG